MANWHLPTAVAVGVCWANSMMHGRDFSARWERLAAGNNGAFWVDKIMRNMERDRRNEADLEAMGWTVVRFWGSDVMRDAGACAEEVRRLLDEAGREG